MKACRAEWSQRAVILALALVCSACAGGSRSQDGFSPVADLPEAQADDEIFNVSNSNADEGNLYASTVLVFHAGNPECSGVLIHRRLVLTAGHCVCAGREENDTITFDGSTCARTTKITAIAYSAPGVAPYSRDYAGTVSVHRDFKAILKKKRLRVPPGAMVDGLITNGEERYVIVNTVQESQADLALIFLDEDAEILFPVVPPARTNIRPRDPVVVVGYGADTVQNGLVSFDSKRLTRRFGRNLVTQSVREKFTIEAPGSLALPGDSGGPCFREDKDKLTLVGINSRSSPGKKSTFTSTYHYLSWLDAELQHANQM